MMIKKMNKKLQFFKIEKKLKSLGLDSDLFDIEHLIDSSLSYSENEDEILSKFNLLDKNNLYHCTNNLSKKRYNELTKIAIKKWIRHKFKNPDSKLTFEDFYPNIF